MPILDIEIVTAEALADDLATRLADMAGEIFGSPPASTWVRLRALPPHQYAENRAGDPEGWRAIFVTVLKAQCPTGAALESEVRSLAEGVAKVCARPIEYVHVLYQPNAQGRIAFGGRLRE
jgi:phenylpyruvate tautomerase PptA (4-oxalocrotonate tautomerase family)